MAHAGKNGMVKMAQVIMVKVIMAQVIMGKVASCVPVYCRCTYYFVNTLTWQPAEDCPRTCDF